MENNKQIISFTDIYDCCYNNYFKLIPETYSFFIKTKSIDL